jgi:hypothetical protein
MPNLLMLFIVSAWDIGLVDSLEHLLAFGFYFRLKKSIVKEWATHD